MPQRPSIDRHAAPYKMAGAALLAIVTLFAVLLAKQFHGDFASRTELTVISTRAGLVVDPGSKVTLNGVEIGRVAGLGTTEIDVTDTGYSLAPYNHVELGRPLLVDNVWGRQIGEYTINP